MNPENLPDGYIKASPALQKALLVSPNRARELLSIGAIPGAKRVGDNKTHLWIMPRDWRIIVDKVGFPLRRVFAVKPRVRRRGIRCSDNVRAGEEPLLDLPLQSSQDAKRA